MTLLRSECFTDETHERHSLQSLLAIECASPAWVLPLGVALALLCAALVGPAAGLAAAAALCAAAYAAAQRRKEAMLELKLGGARGGSGAGSGSGSLLDRLSAAEAAWLQGSSAQQLGQISEHTSNPHHSLTPGDISDGSLVFSGVNPALMSVEILRERICRSCELISLPHATAGRYELFIGNSTGKPVRMDPDHAVGVYAVRQPASQPASQPTRLVPVSCHFQQKTNTENHHPAPPSVCFCFSLQPRRYVVTAGAGSWRRDRR